MPGPQPKYAITLAPEQEAWLEHLSLCSMAPFATVQRAQLVLLAPPTRSGRMPRSLSDWGAV